MAKKAVTFYEVFAGKLGSTGSSAKGTLKKPSRGSSRTKSAGKKRGKAGVGDHLYTFSLSRNALLGIFLMLVVGMAGMFAFGRFTVEAKEKGAVSASIPTDPKPNNPIAPKKPKPERVKVKLLQVGTYSDSKAGRSSSDSFKDWLIAKGIKGVFKKPQGDKILMLVRVPNAGVQALKSSLLALPAYDSNFRFTKKNMTGMIVREATITVPKQG